MWNGDLIFYNNFINGDYSEFLLQHNEHRIIFTRFLFLIDNYFYSGNFKFLLISNVFLLSAIIYLFICIQRSLIINNYSKFIINCFTISFMFSWMQSENITWAFQSQFFAAYLFPMLSFYFAFKSTINSRQLNFIYAIVFTILSIGTMANGVLAIPISIFLLYYSGASTRRLIIFSMLTLTVLAIHFYFYVSPPFHDSIFQSFKQNNFNILLFLFAYLGSPIFYIFKSLNFALLSGFLYISIYLIIIYLYFIKKFNKDNGMILVIISLITYIILTALLTSLGRSSSGIPAAFASRYTTASIVGWISLISIIFPFVKSNIYNKIVQIFCILLITLSIPIQMSSMNSSRENLYERYISILALKLKVNDDFYLLKIFPYTDWLKTMAKDLIDARLGIFNSHFFLNTDRLVNLNNNLVSINEINAFKDVPGYVDRFDVINNEPLYNRIYGWMLPRSSADRIEKIYIIDQNYNIVGLVFSGSNRPDVQIAHGDLGLHAGFSGYILKSASSNDITFVNLTNKSKFEYK
jgi:hypothetical protein